MRRGERGSDPTAELIKTIEIKNKEGRVVERKEVVTAKGLLHLAHKERLSLIRTRLVQAPTKENGDNAIALVRVVTSRGSFTGLGDANPRNVQPRVAPHFIRMAETRALARALRAALDIGAVAIEELETEFDLNESRIETSPPDARRSQARASDEQPRDAEKPRNDPSSSRSHGYRAAQDLGRELMVALAKGLRSQVSSANVFVRDAAGDHGAASAWYRQAMASTLPFQRAELLLDRAFALSKQGRYDESLEVFDHAEVALRDVEHVSHLEQTSRLAPTSVVVSDFDWTAPTSPPSGEERGEDPVGRDHELFEHRTPGTIGGYDEGARTYQAHDHAEQARLRLEAAARDRRVISGRGTVCGLGAGVRCELVDETPRGARSGHQ